MLLLVSLMMLAIGERPRVITGRIRPFAVSPLAGTSPSFTEKKRSIKDPMMKEGMETKAVEMTMIILSRTVFLFKAAEAPSTTPATVAQRAAISPSLAEVLRPSLTTSMTILPLCFRDGPKSNLVNASTRYVQYCSMRGLSRPYLASRAACTAGVMAFSLANGPPGTKCMTKKVMVNTTQTVRTASKILLTM